MSINESITLEDLADGLPGLTTNLGASFAEACVVCLSDQGHQSGIMMALQRDFPGVCQINWKLLLTKQLRDAWADMPEATEAAATCNLVNIKLTQFTIIRRSRKGTGFDYWLGRKEDVLFQDAARLEISGILSGSKRAIAARVRQKLKQTSPTDDIRVYYRCRIQQSCCISGKKMTSTTTLNELHEQAMQWAEQADRLKRMGQDHDALELYQQAVKTELEVAQTVNEEPSRSVLYRSAALLALDSNDIALAEKLVAQGLAGNPPPEIRAELRELSDQIARRARTAFGPKLVESARYGQPERREIGIPQTLVAQVAKKVGVSQRETRAIVSEMLDSIIAALRVGEKVTLTGFGTFEVRKAAPHAGINPATRHETHSSAVQATFSAGSVLKTAVSAKYKSKRVAAPKAQAKKK